MILILVGYKHNSCESLVKTKKVQFDIIVDGKYKKCLRAYHLNVEISEKSCQSIPLTAFLIVSNVALFRKQIFSVNLFVSITRI